MRISDWSSDVCSSDLRYNHRFGDGKSTDYNFFVNAGHDIGTLELYAFGSYGIRDANAAGFYRRSNDSRNRDYGASLTDFVPSDRKRVVEGKGVSVRVDLGWHPLLTKNKNKHNKK